MWVLLAPLLLFLSPRSVDGYKFLAVSPQFANSHVNFIARIADVLIDAGHEVVILSQKVDRNIKDAGTKKARVIEIPMSELAASVDDVTERVVRNVWASPSSLTLVREVEKMLKSWIQLSNETLHRPGLVEQLRAEKFDAGFAEALDYFPYGLFHLLGIEKFAVTQSFAVIDGRYHITQSPSNPAYVPAMMSANDDKMSFIQRLVNFLQFYVMATFGEKQADEYQKVFEHYQPGFPDILDVVKNNSLVFLNSDPLLNFPRPTVHRVIDIGGITVSSEPPKKLDEKWSVILNRRNQTILLSFGTFVKAYGMPEEYKQNIRETFAKFPYVTFIWKYEKPEDNVAGGVENIVETRWMPQNDLLHDPRLTAFITHGGQGSITEATAAGVPLICIPVATDQLRNSAVVRRNGIGVVLAKEDLGDSTMLEEAIRTVLEDKSYREKAKHTSAMLRDRPFPVKETFVRNMEFMVKHGPLRMFDHAGADLNILQFYLIDVFAFLLLIVLILISIVILGITALIHCICRRWRTEIPETTQIESNRVQEERFLLKGESLDKPKNK